MNNNAEQSDRELVVRVVAMPADTNPAGDLFGGGRDRRGNLV